MKKVLMGIFGTMIIIGGCLLDSDGQGYIISVGMVAIGLIGLVLVNELFV